MSAPPPAPSCEPDPRTGHCITCSDEGVEGVVVALLDPDTALVDCGGEPREVAVELLEDVGAGDRVLVHAGVAIARLAPRGSAEGRRP
jgi:hydrogenase maturation factor